MPRYNKVYVENTHIVSITKYLCSKCDVELKDSTLFENVVYCPECGMGFRIRKIKPVRMKYNGVDLELIEKEYFNLGCQK